MTDILKREFRFLARPLNLTSGCYPGGVVALRLSIGRPGRIKLVARNTPKVSRSTSTRGDRRGNNGNDIVEINI